MASEMVERVARAICKARMLPGSNPVARLSDTDRKMAIAAIDAMREPDNEMIDAGRDVGTAAPYGLYEVRERWQAMIDAVLA